MQWHFVNAMTFETETHRVRKISLIDGTSHWLAERKACCDEHGMRIPGKFESQEFAQSACERDSYALASGR